MSVFNLQVDLIVIYRQRPTSFMRVPGSRREAVARGTSDKSRTSQGNDDDR